MANYQKFLKGKKILITSYSYAAFGGAELNAVELADQLVQFGAEPTFFSYDIDGPLAKHIEKRFNTKVLTDRVHRLAESEDDDEMGVTKLDINDYDYIWIGGNTVPISLLRQINDAKVLPKFIFIHMSPLIAFPLDAPLMPDFEKKIASKILTISPVTTKDAIERILGKKLPLGDWRNPVPPEFKKLKKRSGELRKIAVISSSHPGESVMGIKRLLKERGIEVEYVGRFNNNVKVVDAAFYDDYDLILGIGKNARYSLVSGVPIYIYGRFAGGGYISEDNLEKNEAYNFSGRGFAKKTANEIANEIVDGYNDALAFHEKHRKTFMRELPIDSVAENLFRDLEASENKTVHLKQQDVNWLVSTQINIMQRMQNAAVLRRSQERVRKLERELKLLQTSKSWKVTKPIRSAGKVIKKLRKK